MCWMRWAERVRSGGEKYPRLTRASKAGLHSFSLSKLIGRKLSGPVWRVGERSRWRKRDGYRLKFREERLNTRLVEERQTKGRTKKDANRCWKTREREKNKMDGRLKNQRSELEKGDRRGTVAHRHAIMRRLGLIYTRVRRRHHGKSIARPKEKETSVALFKRRSLVLIGSLPLFQPGVPVLEFVSSAGIMGNQKQELFQGMK